MSGMNESYTEKGEPISEIFEHWSNLTYDGIIVDYCEIPEMPLKIRMRRHQIFLPFLIVLFFNNLKQ